MNCKSIIVFLIYFMAGVSLQARELPELSGRVVDESGLLSDLSKEKLENQLALHEEKTSNQIVVLIIDSLEGDVLEDFSIKVAQKWKLGQKGKDNGILLLIVKSDRKLRIEVGYGLESKMTDVRSKQIIDLFIIPKFKDRQFEKGVLSGVDAIISSIDGNWVAPKKKKYRKVKKDKTIGNYIGMAIGFFALICMAIAGLYFYYTIFMSLIRTSGIKGWVAMVIAGPCVLIIPAGLTLLLLGLKDSFVWIWILYCMLYFIARIVVQKTDWGYPYTQIDFEIAGSGSIYYSSDSYSSSGSSSSFSGGGGSFGGGGSSGSW